MLQSTSPSLEEPWLSRVLVLLRQNDILGASALCQEFAEGDLGILQAINSLSCIAIDNFGDHLLVNNLDALVRRLERSL